MAKMSDIMPLLKYVPNSLLLSAVGVAISLCLIYTPVELTLGEEGTPGELHSRAPSAIMGATRAPDQRRFDLPIKHA